MLSSLKKAVKKVFSLAGVNKTLTVNHRKINIPYSDSFYTVGRNDITGHFVVQVIRRLGYTNERLLFVDVGANIGQTLLSVKTYFPTFSYLGFEPNPVCARYLNKLIAANHYKDAWVVPVALAETNGYTSFFKSGETDTLATMVEDLRPEKTKEDESLSVPTLRFDDLKHVSLAAEKIIVKVDVEGAELTAIKGMVDFINKKQPVFIVEVLHCDPRADINKIGARARDLASLFHRHGYRIYNIIHKEDGSVDLKFQEEFTMKYWGEKSIEECDYVITKEVI